MGALLEALENHNSKAVMANASSHLAKGRPSWAPVVGVVLLVALAVLAAMFAGG